MDDFSHYTTPLRSLPWSPIAAPLNTCKSTSPHQSVYNFQKALDFVWVFIHVPQLEIPFTFLFLNVCLLNSTHGLTGFS